MTKSDYLEQLSHKLRVLPESERRDAVEYYDGYISDADDEAAAISSLGTPGEVAANILANYVTGNTAENSPTEVTLSGPPAKTPWYAGIKTTWVVILALFAVPIGVPLAIAVAAVAFALVITLGSLILAFAFTGVAFVIAGIFGFLTLPFIVFQDFGFAILSAGSWLLLLGFGILFIRLTALCMRGFPAISRFVSKKIIGRKNHGR